MRGVWMAAGAMALTLLAGGQAEAADKLKACWVYFGPHNDGGWSQSHDAGRLAVEKELGDKVETSFIENIAEGPDSERAIDRLARSGCGLIFGTSFGYMDPIIKVAAKYPDVKFEHCTGFKTAANVTTYDARVYEARYIAGQIAAKQSKTGVGGFIGSFPIPQIVMGMNAFMLGAQSINPDYRLKVIWVNSWFDPGKEGDAAKALFDQGADSVSQYTDSPAPLQIAEERKLHGFGLAHDMSSYAPNAQYTSMGNDWGPYYVKRVKAVLDGTWKGQANWEGIKEGMVTLTPYRNLPDDVVTSAKDLEAKIVVGAFHPFTGPVYKQDGTEIVAAGSVIDDGTLLGTNWYVKGIEDKLPQ
jgi:simple sugar transport system substrate-binding protein